MTDAVSTPCKNAIENQAVVYALGEANGEMKEEDWDIE